MMEICTNTIGDIDDEEEVLDWLTSPANMEMTDHIEQVNRKMFEKIRKNSDYVAVIFCRSRVFILIRIISNPYPNLR